jgi:hypothetical protein
MAVKILFGAEIVVKHGFVDTGRVGNGLGPRSVESVRSELLCRSSQDSFLRRRPIYQFFVCHESLINRKVKPSGWLILFLGQKPRPVKKKERQGSRCEKEPAIQLKGSAEEKTTNISNLKISDTESSFTPQHRLKGEH